MRYNFCFFVFFIFVFNASNSQDYRHIFDEKYDISKDSAKVYSTKLSNSTKLSEKAFGLASKAYILSREGDYRSSHEHIYMSLKTLEKIKNLEAKANAKMQTLYYYSNLLLAEHKIYEANEVINEGFLLSKELNDATMQIKFNDILGRSFSLLELDKKAIEIGKETIAKLKALKSNFPKSKYNASMLRYYLNLSNRNLACYYRDSIQNKVYLDSTLHHLNTAKQFVKEQNLQPNKYRQIRFLMLESDVLLLKKSYRKAIVKYKETLTLANELNLKKRAYQIQFRLGECHFYLKEYDKSKALFDNLSKIDLEKYSLLKNGIVINYYYARIYSELGDNDRALENTKIYNEKLEAYYKKKSNLKIDAYTTNELRVKKEILEKLSIQEEASKTLAFYLYATLTFIVFGCLLAILFYKKQKRKFKAKFENLNQYIETLKSNGSNPVTKKVNEAKANGILLKLKEIESEHLFIDVNYSLNFVAKKIGSNSAYVSQVVNEHWGKSFVQYTNELRINYILLKLKEDKLYQKFTLAAIAESVGYKSLSSFNKHFKAITGILPKHYLAHLKDMLGN